MDATIPLYVETWSLTACYRDTIVPNRKSHPDILHSIVMEFKEEFYLSGKEGGVLFKKLLKNRLDYK